MHMQVINKKEINKFLLTLLLVLSTSGLFATLKNELIKPSETLKYKLLISSIDYDQKEDEKVAHIVLSDQSKWAFSVQKETAYLLDDLEKDLVKGREIIISPHLHTPYYNLYPLHSKRFYVVELAKDTKDTVPHLVKVNSIEVQSESWFSEAMYIYEVYLSDGSVWKTDKKRGRSKCLESWKEGDPIMASRHTMDKWDLINFNASHSYLVDDLQWDNRSFYNSTGGTTKVYLFFDATQQNS